MAMMTVERQLPRNKRTIKLDKSAATVPSRTTPPIAALTKMDWSLSVLIFRVLGSCCLICFNLANTPSTTLRVEVEPCLSTVDKNRPRSINVDDASRGRISVAHMANVAHKDGGAVRRLDRMSLKSATWQQSY